jgi:hypothetical protein
MFAIERRWKMSRPDYWRDDMGKCSVTLYKPSQWMARPGLSQTRTEAEHRCELYRFVADSAEYRVVPVSRAYLGEGAFLPQIFTARGVLSYVRD